MGTSTATSASAQGGEIFHWRNREIAQVGLIIGHFAAGNNRTLPLR